MSSCKYTNIELNFILKFQIIRKRQIGSFQS